MLEALLGFAGIFALSLLRIPIGFSMGIVGFVGLGILRNWNSSYSSVTQTIYESGFNYVLSVIPLFILMGNLISRAGMSKELFDAAHSWIGHWRGGLAHATVVASAGFGSIRRQIPRPSRPTRRVRHTRRTLVHMWTDVRPSPALDRDGRNRPPRRRNARVWRWADSSQGSRM